MRYGMRLTFVANGDPLLGQTWEYKTVTGVEAIEQKVDDCFFYLDKLKAKDVVDTLYVGLDANGEPYLPNTGVNGDVWPVTMRLERYRANLLKYGQELLLEVEYPTAVVDTNWQLYAEYTFHLIQLYPWVKRWQLTTQPELRDEAGVQKCSPLNYVRLARYVAERVRDQFADVYVGGPGILTAVREYVDSAYENEDGEVCHTGWLAEATGELYGVDPLLDDTGRLGILDCLDFFAFQGRQNYVELGYTVFKDVFEKMKTGLNDQAQRNGFNLTLPFLSTYQGHQADLTSHPDTQLQAFRDLREFMNCYAVGVEPFKAQLVDEFFDETDANAVKNSYGVFYYYMGTGRKVSYTQYKFMADRLEEFTRLPVAELNQKNKRPFEDSDEVEYLMLMNEELTKLVTVVWPVAERNVTVRRPTYTKVSLKASLNRRYYLPDGSTGLLSKPVDVEFKSFDFLVVEETLKEDYENEPEVDLEVRRKLALYEAYTQSLLDLVPPTYPHEAYDTNFYELLRAIGIAFGDAEHERVILDENAYLATAHQDAIYRNFGVMLDLPRKARWTYEEYRRIVSGLFESLLKGATKASVTKAVQLFTSLKTTIYEMFKDYKHYGLKQEDVVNQRFHFTVEVEKPLDLNADVENLVEDVRTALDITRPAHTIGIMMMILSGDENYRDWFSDYRGGKWDNADDLLMLPTFEKAEGWYGWRSTAYPLVLQPPTVDLNAVDELDAVNLLKLVQDPNGALALATVSPGSRLLQSKVNASLMTPAQAQEPQPIDGLTAAALKSLFLQTQADGAVPIGPRYVLYDRTRGETLPTIDEDYGGGDDVLEQDSAEVFTVKDEYYDRPPFDSLPWFHYEVFINEPTYGTKNDLYEGCVLKYSGGRVSEFGDEGRVLNQFHYGFGYLLDDVDEWLVRVLWDEYFDDPDEGYMGLGPTTTLDEDVPDPIEQELILPVMDFKEIRYGYDAYTEEAIITMASPTPEENIAWRRVNRFTDSHRWGVRYRLHDEDQDEAVEVTLDELVAAPELRALIDANAVFVEEFDAPDDDPPEPSVELFEDFDAPDADARASVDAVLAEVFPAAEDDAAIAPETALAEAYESAEDELPDVGAELFEDVDPPEEDRGQRTADAAFAERVTPAKDAVDGSTGPAVSLTDVMAKPKDAVDGASAGGEFAERVRIPTEDLRGTTTEFGAMTEVYRGAGDDGFEMYLVQVDAQGNEVVIKDY